MSSPAAAQRVASTIRTVKWVVIAVQLLVALVTGLVGVAADDSSAMAFSLLGALTFALSAVVTWVMFGWFEHTLSMLSQVALNTSHPAAQYVPASAL